jgi:thiamine transporter ThiT
MTTLMLGVEIAVMVVAACPMSMLDVMAGVIKRATVPSRCLPVMVIICPRGMLATSIPRRQSPRCSHQV